MKTVICDICGKTKDEILIYRYKREGLWCSLWNNDLPKFDICKDCLNTVKKLREKAGEENETD